MIPSPRAGKCSTWPNQRFSRLLRPARRPESPEHPNQSSCGRNMLMTQRAAASPEQPVPTLACCPKVAPWQACRAAPQPPHHLPTPPASGPVCRAYIYAYATPPRAQGSCAAPAQGRRLVHPQVCRDRVRFHPNTMSGGARRDFPLWANCVRNGGPDRTPLHVSAPDIERRRPTPAVNRWPYYFPLTPLRERDLVNGMPISSTAPGVIRG